MLYTCDSVDTEFVRLQAIRQGLPVSFVDEIVQSGAITLGEVNELILPKKTLSHRRQAGTLTPGQSDKLARVARVVAKVRIPRSSRALFRFDRARDSEMIARSVPI